jgi:hypothetical protein
LIFKKYIKLNNSFFNFILVYPFIYWTYYFIMGIIIVKKAYKLDFLFEDVHCLINFLTFIQFTFEFTFEFPLEIFFKIDFYLFAVIFSIFYFYTFPIYLFLYQVL